MPKVFAEFTSYVRKLEAHYSDMQDIEFTVEKGRLWMLQTRNGKRTAKAALKIAVDLAAEGTLTREQAIKRIDPASLDQLLHPTLDPKAEKFILATGLPASPGAASGDGRVRLLRSRTHGGRGAQGHPRAHRDEP
jgi:pyruvate,orthophosphate dikinase